MNMKANVFRSFCIMSVAVILYGLCDVSYGRPIDISINGGKIDTVFRKPKLVENLPILAVRYPESGKEYSGEFYVEDE